MRFGAKCIQKMITRIDPPLPLNTPKGKALAHFLIDYGFEHDLYWVCFKDDNKDCWTWNNNDIREKKNEKERKKNEKKKKILKKYCN